jgi:Aldehyde oxidase and xanthine dehydrogenase, a/b hammerhead domain
VLSGNRRWLVASISNFSPMDGVFEDWFEATLRSSARGGRRLAQSPSSWHRCLLIKRMMHAFVLRSPVAHAHIKRIDTAAARRMPGVLFVATGEDVRADGLGDVPCWPRHFIQTAYLRPARRRCRSRRRTDRTPSGLTGGSRALAVAGATLYEAGRFARTSIDQV